MTLKETQKRITELERRVKELETRPAQHVHHHYPLNPAIYQPTYPTYPAPYPSYPSPWWEVTCATATGSNLTISA